MKLSDLCKKCVYTNTTFQGVCRGVGLSLKSHAVRYLLCASSPTQTNTDFSVGVNAVAEIGERIQLSRLRPASPKGCAKIAIGLPVYSFDGGFLGRVADLDLHDFTATTLYTDRGERFPILSVFACSDAVILRKEQPYPLGQRIPAPLLSLVTDKNDGVVTKPILRTAIQKKALVTLTLSLPPFRFELPPTPSNGVFRG
jgi:sporulation protein YlmC with PRC-barrel domain